MPECRAAPARAHVAGAQGAKKEYIVEDVEYLIELGGDHGEVFGWALKVGEESLPAMESSHAEGVRFVCRVSEMDH